MASKRRQPPPPPRAPAPQNPQPPSAAAHSSSSEDSDSDTDPQGFQLRQLPRSPAMLPHRAPWPESDADDDVESSESEPENPEPVVQKVKGKATAVEKSDAEHERKRPAPEAAPSSKAKKVKSDADKAVAEATSAGKGKKAKAEAQMAAPEPTPSGKGKKAGGKEKPPALDSAPPSSNSEKHARARSASTKDDDMKILEALADHVRSAGALPKTGVLLSAVRDHLSMKSCSYSEIYEKVGRLKEKYEKALSKGSVPSKEDELHMYNLSEAVWGEMAKEAATATPSQNDGAVKKSKKGQANKEKMNGNSKDGIPKEATTVTSNQNGGDSQKAGKKGQATTGKTSDADVKSRLSKEAATTSSSSKSKKQRYDKVEAATTATQNGGALAKSKRGKTDKEKMEIDTESLVPKEATTATQNGGIPSKSKEGETHEEIETDDNAQGMRRSFNELQNLYPNLAAYVKRIEAEHPCGETLKRAFEFIDDEKAQTLEDKIKKQAVAEIQAQMHGADIKKDVFNRLMSLVD